MNRLITSNEMISNQKLTANNSQQGSSTKHKKNDLFKLLKLFKNLNRKKHSPISFHDATFTLIAKPDIDTTKKKEKKIRDQSIQCIKTQNSNAKY